MNPEDRLNLQRMIQTNNVEDLTFEIKTKKHSKLIRDDVSKLSTLKKKYARLAKTNQNEYTCILKSQCSFLFNNYTDIFNRIKNDDLDLNIFWKLIETLKTIEDGKYNQHEASFEVGKLLKKLYIDSAVRESDRIEKTRKKYTDDPDENNGKKISWKEFKELNLKNN